MQQISMLGLWLTLGMACLVWAEPGQGADRLDWETNFARRLVELPQQKALALSSPRPLGFAPRPDLSLIVTFGVDRAGTMDAELWLSPIGGGALTRLGAEPATHIAEAVASPDGDYVAYLARPLMPQGRHAVGKVGVIELSSGRRSVIAPDAAWPVTWLPCGRELLCSRPVAGGYRAFRAILLAEEITIEPIVDATFESPVVFSPDGQRFAATLGGALVVIERGTGRRTELRNSVGVLTGGVWSPDSEWLAFSSSLQSIGGTRERHEALQSSSGRLIPLTSGMVEEVVGRPSEGEIIEVGSKVWLPGEEQRLLVWAARRKWNGSCLGDLSGDFGQAPVREGKWVTLDFPAGTAAEADWMPGPAAGVNLWEPFARFSSDGRLFLVNGGRSFVLYRRVDAP